jgi:hypothetical protein
MPAVICPSCHRPLPAPNTEAGCYVVCPKCAEAVLVAAKPEKDAEAALAAGPPEPLPEPEAPPLPRPARFGVAAVALGLLAVMLLCVPVLGYYAAVSLSGAGLLVGLWGLGASLAPGGAARGGSGAGGAAPVAGFLKPARDFPLAGIAACLLALVLALLPWLT